MRLPFLAFYTKSCFKMNRVSLKVLSIVAFVIFLVWFLYSFYFGIITPPSEGDSLIIHIPAAKKVLEGTIFTPDIQKDLFYPSAIELILAVFILFKIPLGLFNVIGVCLLFIASYLLGKMLLKDKQYAIIFSVSVSLLHGVIRWTLTQKVDIYMLAFFVLVIYFLMKKKRGVKDFFLMGLCGGFFVGAKFNGPLYYGIAVLPFFTILKEFINFKKMLAFFLPMSLIGLSWFIRNIVITGDPFYFPDYSNLSKSFLLSNYNFYAFIFQPVTVFNAYMSEYMIWSFGLVFIPLYLVIGWARKTKIDRLVLKLYAIAFIIFITSLIFPYRELLHQIIGTMRYTLPMIFLIILCIFLIFKKHKLEKLISLWVISTIIISQIPDYHPKLLLIAIPIITIVYFFSNSLKKIRL